MIKWTIKGTTHSCDIGDVVLYVYKQSYSGAPWEADCGKYMDHSTLMADNVDDALQEALDDLLSIAAAKAASEAQFVQTIITAMQGGE